MQGGGARRSAIVFLCFSAMFLFFFFFALFIICLTHSIARVLTNLGKLVEVLRACFGDDADIAARYRIVRSLETSGKGPDMLRDRLTRLELSHKGSIPSNA